MAEASRWIEHGLVGPFAVERMLMPHMSKDSERAEVFPVEWRMRHGSEAWEKRIAEIAFEREMGERE